MWRGGMLPRGTGYIAPPSLDRSLCIEYVLTHFGRSPRGCRFSPDQVLTAIAGQFPDLRDTWAEETWHVATIDSTRGHSRDRSLMHPCYVLIHADDYWAFNQRPHGLVELVLGDRDLSFPCILPQMINFPIVQAFLAPLVPGGLECVAMNVWYNGATLDFHLVNCFDGFFVQVTVNVPSPVQTYPAHHCPSLKAASPHY